jgi:hypothetical protein
MGWKGTLRSVGSTIRAAERDEKRRQKELEKQQKQYDKMQELEQAKYDVEVYENLIDRLQSVHKECSDVIDWEEIANSSEPEKPSNQKSREKTASVKADRYSPGFFDKLFDREEKKRNLLKALISAAIKKDNTQNDKDIEEWNTEYFEWEEGVQLARGLLDGNAESKINAIEKLNSFSEISDLGSTLSFKVDDDSVLEVTINVHGDDVVPNVVKSLLKSGQLSVKNMPKGKFNELFQDYVCSCVLRVANEVFSIILDEKIFVTAVNKMLNLKTGHLEDSPILSVCVSRKTLHSLNMNNIDPSDSMSNFIHKMSFKKTKGFERVERLETSCLERA